MRRNSLRRSAVADQRIDGALYDSGAPDAHYRICKILGAEVRVWGAAASRALNREVTVALRAVIKRVDPALPIALMADHHPAEHGVVGSVIPSDDRLVPDLIGSDCGCGVLARRLRTSGEDLGIEALRKLFDGVRRAVPVGTAQNKQVDSHIEELEIWNDLRKAPFVSPHELRRLRYQLGSLGGGNHFIELAEDSANQIWLLVHTGSRYLGGLLNNYFRGRDIPLGTDEAESFLRSQDSVLEFARQSRREIADRVVQCMETIGFGECIESQEEVDLAHNFIELDITDSPIAIHRKGACSAREGEHGVIPGSMGVGSYLVEGRGSSASYRSSSHGAGRILSRGEAFRQLSSRDLFRDMKEVVWAESEKLKDEAPRAYKDLDQVMRGQRDLLKIRTALRPLLSIKGGA